ncbi:MAG TPA: class E sortase [Ilumatobacteraceae bacterium]|nr:class E sortase [Ilumatobacteraceae bacterium]
MSDVESASPRPHRVRKFDRPAPPHDWRWWVGGVGKTLIATGLLLFGFVAYQLWGTGIETARAQNSLENEFEELLAGTPPTTASPTPTSVDDTVPSSSIVDTVPTESTPEDIVADTTVPLAAAALPPVAEGDPIARIELPRIGIDKIVVAGVEKNDLKKGPGHYPETPLPGQLGNSAIAGHRTTYGQPFFDIDKLNTGDEIIVTTLTGRYVYLVTGQQIVSPSDYQVIATTDPSRATLTLTSCHPKYTARERIIIFAELDPDASTGIVAEPTINYGRPLDEAAPAEPDPSNTVVDPETAVDDATADETPADETAAGGTASTGLDDPTMSAPELDDEQINDGIADAFAEGWFSDPGANGQVALWGLLLAAIGIGSYLLSRKVKRDWVGLLVGIGPFVITLYFFFQNVNRLLPPNL